MAARLTPAYQTFNTANGSSPLAGGKIHFYVSGSVSTNKDTFSDDTLLTANTNPLVLDSAGRVQVDVWGDGDYKMVVADSNDTPISTFDPVSGGAGITKVNTIAELTAITKATLTNGDEFSVSGYYAQGDGVGGNFYWNSASTATANGGTIIASDEGGTGRWLRIVVGDIINVLMFGAVGDGVTDDTADIQAAIDSGSPIVFPAGTYASGPLTQSTNFQRFYADGQVNIIKNANGVLLTSTGIYVELDGIQFLGTGYTGDNINMSGNHPRLINCSSSGTSGRALKATGAHVQIIGTSGSYSTTDATASGYDVEIGVSGTATLYHQLTGIYSSQATGGILLIDTGSAAIVGGQFGKLKIQNGTEPAGANGGMTSNCRILGDVTVELSSAVFTGNQFENQTITFAAGTSGHYLDTSNIISSATIVNNGNGNSVIIKSIGTGSPISGIVLQYGADSNNSTVIYAPDEIYFQDSDLFLANNKALKFADSVGTYHNGLFLSNNDDWSFGANNGANFAAVNSGSAGVYHIVSAVSITQTTASALRPVPDGTINLGGASNRWATVYATTGSINTSDLNEKQDIADLDAVEKRVATALKRMVKKFRFKDAVAQKGDNARIHVGVIAQEVEAAFDAEGLDASQYGIFCYDEWGESPDVVDAEGNILSPYADAGHRYGVRYEELLAFIIAAI